MQGATQALEAFCFVGFSYYFQSWLGAAACTVQHADVLRRLAVGRQPRYAQPPGLHGPDLFALL